MYLHAVPPFADKIHDRIRMRMGVHEDIRNAILAAQAEPDFEHWHTLDRKKALGNGIGERA
jgi:hypothetical protein